MTPMDLDNGWNDEPNLYTKQIWVLRRDIVCMTLSLLLLLKLDLCVSNVREKVRRWPEF